MRGKSQFSITEMLREQWDQTASEIEAAKSIAIDVLREYPGPWEPREFTEAILAKIAVQGRWAQTAGDELVGHGVIKVIHGQYMSNLDAAIDHKIS